MQPVTKGAVLSALSKHTFRTFKFTYTSSYKPVSWLAVVKDPQHPLHEIQKRLFLQQKRSGLWWGVTTANDSSKTRVVKTWLKRRLKTAFVEELKKKGFDKDGRLLDVKKRNLPPGDIVERLLKRGVIPELKGTVKFRVMPPLVTAKGEDVRREASKIVDALCLGLQETYEPKSHTAAMQRGTRNGQHGERMHWGRLPPRPAAATMSRG